MAWKMATLGPHLLAQSYVADVLNPQSFRREPNEITMNINTGYVP